MPFWDRFKKTPKEEERSVYRGGRQPQKEKKPKKKVGRIRKAARRTALATVFTAVAAPTGYGLYQHESTHLVIAKINKIERIVTKDCKSTTVVTNGTDHKGLTVERRKVLTSNCDVNTYNLVKTDYGDFVNQPSWLTGKFNSGVNDIQQDLKVGHTYDLMVTGPVPVSGADGMTFKGNIMKVGTDYSQYDNYYGP